MGAPGATDPARPTPPGSGSDLRSVLPPHGRVILIESVIPAGNEPALGKIIDLEMLVMPGGKERTEQEFRDLFARAGFTLTRVVPTGSPLSVVEAKLV